MYLPLHNVPEKKYYVRIPAKICFSAVSVPLFAFVTCVALTLYKDFEQANTTHCNVPNVFPSISASIGNYEPQSTIWKTAIYLHAPLRLYIVSLRWKNYLKTIREDCDIVVNLAVMLNIVENFSLVGLTYWTSSTHYPFHEKCFILFIGSSISYMFIICILLTKYRRRPALTNNERKSITLKWRYMCINVIMFTIAAICFLRHNSNCEPYVYSLFGLAEYIVVISNIAFHLTTMLDIQINFIYIGPYGVFTELL